MTTNRLNISYKLFWALLVISSYLWGVPIRNTLADDCGWSQEQAQQALVEWQNVVGGFHSELDGGTNAVSYRELIKYWGTPDNTSDPSDPAYELPCALNTFINELNGYPGVDDRESDLLDAVYEISRAEMLLGTEDFIEVLDQDHVYEIDGDHPIASSNAIDEEIFLLEGPRTVPIIPPYDETLYGNFPQGRRDCIGHYKEAVNVFLDGLSFEAGLSAFADQNFSDVTDPLADKSLRTMGLLCRASARKARAYKELADRQFARDYNTPDDTLNAKQTCLIAGQAAYLEAVTIAAVMPEEGIGDLEESGDFQEISGNLTELEKINNNIDGGLNPFGYEDSYVEFKFDPTLAGQFGHRNNYEQMDYLLTNYRDYLGVAEQSISEARSGYQLAQDRMRAAEKSFNNFQEMVQSEANNNEGVRAEMRLQLGTILGFGNANDGLDNDQDGDVDNDEEEYEPDQVSYLSNNGEIGQLVIEIDKASKRIERVEQEIENINSTADVKWGLLKELLRINAEQLNLRTSEIDKNVMKKMKIIKDTGEEMASIAAEEAREKAEASKINGWIDGLLNVAGAIAGAIIEPSSSIKYIVGGVGSVIDGYNNCDLTYKLGDLQQRRERAAALEKANLVYEDGEFQKRISELDAQVYEDRSNAEFEAEITILLFQKETLKIDLIIAQEDFTQQTKRLSAAIKRALFLLQERENFEKRVAELEDLHKFYQDPSARVLEDQKIMTAAKDFRLAAEKLYLTGKALEYEINEKFPRLDDVFKMRTIGELIELQQDLYDKYYSIPEIQNSETTTRTLSLRRDLLGLSPYSSYDPVSDEKFREYLEKNITAYGDLEIKFDTYLAVGNYEDPWLQPLNFFGQPSTRYNDNFPQDHWNQKIVSIQVNINGMLNADENGVSARLTHYGTSFVRSRDTQIDQYGYILQDNVKPWDLEPRTTGSFTASVNGFQDPLINYFNDQLVARSVAVTDWRLVIKGRGFANVEDLLAISDIQIVITSSGYPIQ